MSAVGHHSLCTFMCFCFYLLLRNNKSRSKHEKKAFISQAKKKKKNKKKGEKLKQNDEGKKGTLFCLFTVAELDNFFFFYKSINKV